MADTSERECLKPRIIFVRRLKFFSLVPILTKATSSRQITISRNFGNEVSEKETVIMVSDQCSESSLRIVQPPIH